MGLWYVRIYIIRCDQTNGAASKKDGTNRHEVEVRVLKLRVLLHRSKFVIFQEKRLKVLKCYTFLWVQRRHNCSPAATFEDCVVTLYMLKEHLQTFLSIPLTQKCQILSCDTLVANERYGLSFTAARCTADVSQKTPASTRASHNSCSVHTVIKETLSIYKIRNVW